MLEKEKTKAQLQAELRETQSRLAALESLMAIHNADDVQAQNPASMNSAFYLHSLVHAIPDPVWLKDPNGVYLRCNSAFERLYGAKESDILGKTDYHFVSKELAEFFLKHDRIAMDSGKPSVNEEWLTFAEGGYRGLFETIKTPVFDDGGTLIGVLGIARDITRLRQDKEALEKRLRTLTQPEDEAKAVTFEELFRLDDIQHLQDQFALATGVASIITHPDGSPITAPSNFCRLCKDIIRETATGRANCYKSDALIGQVSPTGPTIQRCMSGGLWDAGAGISVGGRHIANWLIGQVRDESQTVDQMRRYAREIGADESEVSEAFSEVPAMSHEKFEQVARMLFTLANQLSSIAYQNVQQGRFISEHNRVEEALEASKRFLNNIIDSIADPVFVKDQDHRFILVNEALCRVMGKSTSEIIGKSDYDFFPKEQAELFWERDNVVFETQGVDLSEEPITGSSGDILTIHTKKACFIDKTGSKYIVGVIRDITERKRMQELLIQTEKMMSVGGLAAGMAHEINNPLSGIMQSIQVIQNRLFNNSPANIETAEKVGCSFPKIKAYLELREIFDMLQGVHAAGSKAAKIVSTMLEFSRKTDSVKAPTDINSLLDKAVELSANDYDLKKNFDFRKIAIERHYAPDLPPTPCTATRIEQVLLNLLRNAAQAMVKNDAANPPKITLRTRREGENIRIEVQDNGSGMTEEVRKRVFEPFYTTKSPGQGTGLGLSVSYFIITENHKGTLEVESLPGKGSTFIITLPLS